MPMSLHVGEVVSVMELSTGWCKCACLLSPSLCRLQLRSACAVYPSVRVISLTCKCRLHRRHSSGTAKSPQLTFELRPLRISDDGELLKPDGMLSEDEDAALRRTIAALVLNLRGIDPDLRESGLNVLSSLATRRRASACL